MCCNSALFPITLRCDFFSLKANPQQCEVIFILRSKEQEQQQHHHLLLNEIKSKIGYNKNVQSRKLS